MNNIIKEFMEQAGFDPEAIQRMGVMPQTEKFVELIIQKCVKIADHYDDGTISDSDITVGIIKSKIKQHFGI